MKIEYAIVIKSKTRLESLIERFNTKAQAKFYIENLGGNFEAYELEHEIFRNSLSSLQQQLARIIKYKIVEKEFLPSFIFSKNQLIVVIGQDGLVANTAKYSNEIPIVAVNPDQDRYDGILLPFNTSNFLLGIEKVMNESYIAKTVRFAEARLNDSQRLLAFNELFIGASSHVSARYKISFNKKTEEHSSSGIIISTQAGATGWLSSIFNMAYGITSAFGKKLPLEQPKLKENQLLFTVREPFKSVRTQTTLVAGMLNEHTNLVIESLMPSGGVIFSDGIESDFLPFNSGSIARIELSKDLAKLVALKE